MPKYNIRLPNGVGKFNAKDRRSAIDQAIKVWRIMFDKMISSGDIYKIPDVAQLAKPRDGMKELGQDQPMKPSRWGKRKKRL